MNYTIGVMTDVMGDVMVSFEKSGNSYLVGFFNIKTKEYTNKTFNSLEEAQEVFNKFVNAILSGCYSYEQRKAFLD